VQFYSSPPRFFRFTPGLFVEFLGAGGVTRRGSILQVLDGSVKVMDERDGNVVVSFSLSIYIHVTSGEVMPFSA
jgi:hypothetical protein